MRLLLGMMTCFVCGACASSMQPSNGACPVPAADASWVDQRLVSSGLEPMTYHGKKVYCVANVAAPTGSRLNPPVWCADASTFNASTFNLLSGWSSDSTSLTSTYNVPFSCVRLANARA
jgi:hypothetical protein